MGQLRTYWQVAMASAREEGANPKRLIASLLQFLARVALVVAIYRVAYTVNPNPGLSYQNAMWSFGLFFAFALSLGIRNIARVIDTEVQMGTIESGLIKPLDWRLFKLAQLLGRSGLEFLIQLIILPILLWIFVGLPDMSYMTPLIFVVLLVLLVFSMIVVACIFTMIGLSAIWLNDAMPLFRIIDKMGVIFMGSFVPLALMPQLFQEIIRWSPWGIGAAPQLFFNPHVAEVMWQTFASGVVWVVILFAACQFMWARVERRIEVNGG